MKKLIISPQAGFGNRLRTLCAGILLGILTDRTVYHYWVAETTEGVQANVKEMKGLDVGSVFDLPIQRYEGLHADVCFSEWLPGDFWYREQSTAQARLRCSHLVKLSDDPSDIVRCGEETILIETSLEFILPSLLPLRGGLFTQIYQDFFPLAGKWKRIVENLPSVDHGFHIRRGTFLDYFPGSEIGIEDAGRMIDGFKGSKMIFSDDAAFARELRRMTGITLIVDAEETELAGVESAILDFLALARCSNIHGTRGSSFSEQAALFGNRPFRPL